jgi:hypothetical protein
MPPHKSSIARDPRTIARDIPGILNAILPELTPVTVAALNRPARRWPDVTAIADEELYPSSLNRAMLFELSVALAEQLIQNQSINWDQALSVATFRQRRHFDAVTVTELTDSDKAISRKVAINLTRMLEHLSSAERDALIILAPSIPGFRWISTTEGDFAVGRRLIEVKCVGKHFSSADYRQVIIYWLLSYAAALECRAEEWSAVALVNPRLGMAVTYRFDELLDVVSAGTSKVELLQLFSALIGDITDQ